MAIINTDAIVLKQFDLGEADKIITFYSKDNGKIRAVANGVRRSKSSLSGIVLPFSYSNITIYRGRSLAKINQVKNKYSFSVLRENLSKIAHASYMAELVEKVGMEDDPNPSLFSLLLTTYHKMIAISEVDLDYLNLAFKLRLLVILGFLPELEHCVKCGQGMKTTSKNIFDIAKGGTMCFSCYDKQDKVVSYVFSGESLEIMKRLLSSGLKFPKNLKISSKAFKELDELLNKFIIYHLDIKLKSQKFLNMIRNFG